MEGTPAKTFTPNLINLEKGPPFEYSAKYIPPPTPTGIAIIEAMVVIIKVPINAGLIPPASKSSPGGLGSKVNSSGVICAPPFIRI